MFAGGFEFTPTHVERIHLFKSEQVQLQLLYPYLTGVRPEESIV
ncbi:hypothetical protein HMPREF0322_03664 [Desulfitobacterium hafniense DP7]|uniref:Uncharacterized protein n=1 Tax=Desulfitobacterium hafniense DP7 TaxID=537010 RepID=G9XRR6_DESHA|nr:hypothetical protein HMPREF0322_03664 [Desulfitobacterium hafniense DP7]